MRLLCIWLLYSTLVVAGDTESSVGIWSVACGETLLDLIDKLAIPDYQPVLKLNPGLNPEYVQAGGSYRVPYTTAIPPAKWDTINGEKLLHLRLNRTQSCHDDRQAPIATGSDMSAASAPVSLTTSLTMPSTTGSKAPSREGPTNTASAPISSFPMASSGSNIAHGSSTPNSSQIDKARPTVTLSVSPTGLDTNCESASAKPLNGSGEIFQGLKCRKRLDTTAVYGAQEQYAARFCKEYSSRKLDNNSDSIQKMYYYSNNAFFRFVVTWIPNCRIGQAQMLDSSDANCTDLMINNYRKCKTAS